MRIYLAVLGIFLGITTNVFAQQVMVPNGALPPSVALDPAQVREMAKNREAILGSEKQKIIEDLEKEKIHDTIAGQQLRQGAREQAYTRQLVETPLLTPQQEKERARRAYQASKNPKMQALEDTYTSDIWSHVKEEMASYGHEFNIEDAYGVAEANKTDNMYDKSNLYVFISDSVPEITLKNYLEIFDGMNVVYVLRGLIGDNPSKIMPTQAWVKNLLCDSKELNKDSKCKNGPIDINPNLFRHFNIHTVPAIVYMKDTAKLEVCGDVTLKDNEFLLWYGDTNPQYVLQKFIEMRPQDETLLKLVSEINPSIWANEK